MPLYADENFPLRVIEELRRLDHDVITTFQDGRANRAVSDPDLLMRATEMGRAILTLNRLVLNACTFKCRIMPES